LPEVSTCHTQTLQLSSNFIAIFPAIFAAMQHLHSCTARNLLRKNLRCRVSFDAAKAAHYAQVENQCIRIRKPCAAG
jgi:hypothetical protein